MGKASWDRPKTIITIFTLELKLPTVLLSLTFFLLPPLLLCVCLCALFVAASAFSFFKHAYTHTHTLSHPSYVKWLSLQCMYIFHSSSSVVRTRSLIQSFVHHYHNKLYEVIYVYNDSHLHVSSPFLVYISNTCGRIRNFDQFLIFYGVHYMFGAEHNKNKLIKYDKLFPIK